MQKLNRLLAKKEFTFIKQLQKKFPKAEIFLVGGIIRDIIIGRASKDYDFVVRQVPAKSLQQFLKSKGWVDLVGKNFGVLKFRPRGFNHIEPIDIALPRTEHSLLTGGYRDFKIQSDPKLPIAEDLKRRDFTVNALAYDIKNKKLIDLFYGLEDIAKKKIKTVGQPEERFQEDYSRLLRALRFACQLDFNFDKPTWTAIIKQIPHLNRKKKEHHVVPRETVAKELTKTFMADPARAFELYDQSGATKVLMPELLKMKGCQQPTNFHAEGDVWQHTKICLEKLSSAKYIKKFGPNCPSSELVLGLVFHDLGKPYTIEYRDRIRFNNHDQVGAKMAQTILERLKISNAGVNVDHVAWLIRKHLIATHTKKSPMKQTTLEKYFFNDQVPGQDLLKLTFIDIQATIPKSGRPDFTQYKALEKQVSKLKKMGQKKKDLPPEILDGHALMKKFKLKPGPRIGLLKNLLREEQLKGKIATQEQAFKFLKKHVRI